MRTNTIYQQLKNQGQKLTPARRAIIAALNHSHRLLTAPQILLKMHHQGIKVNKTTIYRELDFLHQQKIIKIIQIKPGILHYESAYLPHHHHLLCHDCGQIQEISTHELELPIADLTDRLHHQGIQISDHTLEFSGLCADCR